ncbi:glycosyltransferase family 32 protein [Elysia marginata]|uniref:Glycosyltransferase family 32 protein n=1 Tax=Elysia marginata TaxID=1093978 RepID=A0AAV4I2U1_9GAST|nr:glycosyltransferase family 32 protein [Elysia marginata]
MVTSSHFVTRRRIIARTVSSNIGILVVSFGITMLLFQIYNSRRSRPSCKQALSGIGEEKEQIIHSKAVQKKPVEEHDTPPTSCDIIEFFASIDASARTYYPDLICDELAPMMDIVCRMYFRQVGLEHLAKSSCALHRPDRVPKIVYFVIFGTYVFKFWHYIAFMAAKRNVSPTAIYVIGDQHPQGRWWQRVLNDVHGVRFVYRELPQSISGIDVRFRHHLSDIVRLQILYLNGGIYLDADMVVVRDLEPLLDYDITMGMVENGTGMGNAFIATKRGSPFVREWYTEYSHYSREQLYHNSLQIPRDMWFKNTSRLHVESERLYRPNWFEADLLFKGNTYPWQNNYAVHVWTNGNPVPRSPDEIQTVNTTIAQIFRQAMYGDPRLRKL